jgi:chromosome partitioning protein
MIVAVTGQKGGVGKSTVAIHLASEALEHGMRVLLVDADPQATVRTWSSVAAMAGLNRPTVVAMGADLHQPGQLPELAKSFDFVVVDGPAKLDTVQRAMLLIADLALFPCGPSAVDAWALGDVLPTLQEARRIRPELDAAIVVNRVVPGTVYGRQARQNLSTAGLPVLKTVLAQRMTYQEALAAGKSASTYAPSSEASREARNLFNEVFERLSPQAPPPVASAPRNAKATTTGPRPGAKKTPRSKKVAR